MMQYTYLPSALSSRRTADGTLTRSSRLRAPSGRTGPGRDASAFRAEGAAPALAPRVAFRFFVAAFAI
jgi:hypothetical protein